MKHLFLIAAVVAVSLAGCKKSNPAPVLISSNVTGTPANATVDVNSTPQVSFTMNGTGFAYVTGNQYNAGVGSGSSGFDDYTYSSDIDNGDTITYFNISKGVLHKGFSGTPTDSLFKTFFPVAVIPYSVNAAHGIEIDIWDSNNVHWCTSYGTGDQTGSTFNIVQTQDAPEPFGDFYLKTYITFSCKVYNTAGAMKTVTNGKFVGHFGNF